MVNATDEKYTCEGGCKFCAPLSQYIKLEGGWYECPQCNSISKFVNIPQDTYIDNSGFYTIEFIPDETLFRKEGEPLDIYLFRQELISMWNIFCERRHEYGNHMDKGAQYSFDGINSKVARINNGNSSVSIDTLTDLACYACMAATFKEIETNDEIS